MCRARQLLMRRALGEALLRCFAMASPRALRRLEFALSFLLKKTKHSTPNRLSSAPAVAAAPSAAAARAPAAATAVPGVADKAQQQTVVVYTCRVCETRSARRVSRQALEHGSVLLRCPGCRNVHVIADRLGYFDDATVDAAALLEARGEKVRRGALAGGSVASAGAAPVEGAGAAGAGDVLELLTADDLRVLRSSTMGVRLADGEEVGVATMVGDVLEKRE